jgi:hypothetical protein
MTIDDWATLLAILLARPDDRHSTNAWVAHLIVDHARAITLPEEAKFRNA